MKFHEILWDLERKSVSTVCYDYEWGKSDDVFWICGVAVEEMLGKFITWTFSLFSRLELSWDEVDKIIMVLFWFKFKFKTKTMKK